MKIHKLKDMFRGWVVGNFTPSCYKTDEVEVAVKEYKTGDKEPLHYHKIATEITVIVSGMVLMNGTLYNAGDIITIAPGESTNFEALSDAVTTVIKLPCVPNDKYIV
jgi:mannose-6-phosphate isomerase-like protein (cupin superfamily)